MFKLRSVDSLECANKAGFDIEGSSSWADPVSILPCSLLPPLGRPSYNSGEANAGRSPFAHRALSDIIAAHPWAYPKKQEPL